MGSPGAWRGWKRTGSPCCPPLPAAGMPSSRPSLGLLPALSTPQSCSVLGGGSSQGTCTLTTWGADKGWEGQGTLLDPPAPLSCRHHGHLPVGGLQPPRAARAGPVRHHLAPDLDQSQNSPPAARPAPCPPSSHRDPSLRECTDCPGRVWRPSKSGTLSPPDTRSPPPPRRMPFGAGQALLNFQRHWPTGPLFPGVSPKPRPLSCLSVAEDTPPPPTPATPSWCPSPGASAREEAPPSPPRLWEACPFRHGPRLRSPFHNKMM